MAERRPPDLPAHVGPCEFGHARQAGRRQPPARAGAHPPARRRPVEPGGRRWLVERRRFGPAIRALTATTDPLFRQAATSLGRL